MKHIRFILFSMVINIITCFGITKAHASDNAFVQELKNVITLINKGHFTQAESKLKHLQKIDNLNQEQKEKTDIVTIYYEIAKKVYWDRDTTVGSFVTWFEDRNINFEFGVAGLTALTTAGHGAYMYKTMNKGALNLSLKEKIQDYFESGHFDYSNICEKKVKAPETEKKKYRIQECGLAAANLAIIAIQTYYFFKHRSDKNKYEQFVKSSKFQDLYSELFQDTSSFKL